MMLLVDVISFDLYNQLFSLVLQVCTNDLLPPPPRPTVLHCHDLHSRHFPNGQPIRAMHQTRMEAVFFVLAASHRHPVAVPHLRGDAVRCVHDDHAGHTDLGHLERRNGIRLTAIHICRMY